MPSSKKFLRARPKDPLILNFLGQPGQPLREVNLESRHLLNGKECRVVVIDIAERKLAESLRTSEQQLRQLSHEILLAQEAERKRLSRELHDTVIQTLAGIKVHLVSLTPKSVDDPASVRRKIPQTQWLVDKIDPALAAAKYDICHMARSTGV